MGDLHPLNPVVTPLWAPWRMEYILAPKGEGCFLCTARDEGDPLLVHRTDTILFILNRYPYNPGHLLIAPHLHVGDYLELSDEICSALSAGIRRAIQVYNEVMRPDGYNIGLNLGKVAGAGLEEHIHYHLVPRYLGDTNFMTTIADIRVIPEHLLKTAEKLREAFSR